MSSRVSGPFADLASALAEVGRRFDARGWVQGTSGNFSAVITPYPLTLTVTPSSAHKGRLSANDFLHVDEFGRSASGQRRPSAETLLHLEIVRARGAGAVLHTHSVWSTMLSERQAREGGVSIAGYEMLKGLAGVSTHEHHEWVPIVGNDQNMPRLASQVRDQLMQHPTAHAFLIAGHGLYTWGQTITDAERHVEILEFLLEAELWRS
jgi:methylthioribulose-1-phosphate dehydratase